MNKDIPQHVAIIMDGNGRWAKSRLLPRVLGHKSGAMATQLIVEAAIKAEVKILTLFAFSTENWQRPKEEIDELMELFLTQLEKQLESLNEQKIRLKFIGDLENLDPHLKKRFLDAMSYTEKNNRLELVLAVNYGGQWDIVQATKKIAQLISEKKIKEQDVTPEFFQQQLSTADIPCPDLMIRTSGELRISNFLLWQLAYTEFYFTDVLWPDFTEHDFNLALKEYAKRKRRYGKII